MDYIKTWLELAKEGKLVVTNVAASDAVSVCINLLSIPKSDAVAVTISVIKNQKKKNALPPGQFSAVMRIFERTLRDIDAGLVQASQFFKPVGLNTEWYKILDCHRIFFIPETSVAEFISTFLSRNKLNAVKANGIADVALIAETSQYQFISNF